jgi:hypothetical protein
MTSRWRLVSWVTASVLVLGAGGFLAFRRIARLHTVPGTDDARAFALVNDRAYAIVGSSGYEVRAIDLTSGDYARLAAGEGDGEAIATDDKWVVWSVCDVRGVMPCRGRTLTVSLAGGAPRVLLDDAAMRIVVAKQRAYMVNDRALRVADLERKTEPEAIAIGVEDVAADESYVYALTASTLRRLPHGSRNPQELARSLRDASWMSLGHDGAYVACQNSRRDDGEVTYVPFDGSPPVVLARGLRNPERPVAWGASVAFIHAIPDAHDNSLAVLTLSLVPRGGGDRRTLRDHFSGDLVSDGRRLYVVVYDRVIRIPGE